MILDMIDYGINWSPIFFHNFIGFEFGIKRITIVPNWKGIYEVTMVLWPFQ